MTDFRTLVGNRFKIQAKDARVKQYNMGTDTIRVDTDNSLYRHPQTRTYNFSTYGLDSEGNSSTPSIYGYVSTRSPVAALDAEDWSGSGSYTDDTGRTWTMTGGSKASANGILAFEMDGGSKYLETSQNQTMGQYYTHYYIWRPRESSVSTNWRTLFRGNNDHSVIINNGALDLGMYSNRNGAFRDTGYNITTSNWQTLIVVGTGDSSTASTGTQLMFVDGTYVGSTDRVVSGTTVYRLGWSDNQGPGYFLCAGIFNTALSNTEVATFDGILQSRLSSGSTSSTAVIGFNNLIGETFTTTSLGTQSTTKYFSMNTNKIIKSENQPKNTVVNVDLSESGGSGSSSGSSATTERWTLL